MEVPKPLIKAFKKSEGLTRVFFRKPRVDLTDLLLNRATLRLVWMPAFLDSQPVFRGLWCYYSLVPTGYPELRERLQEHGFDGVVYIPASSEYLEISGRAHRIIHSRMGELRGFSSFPESRRMTLNDGRLLVEPGRETQPLVVEMTVSIEEVRHFRDRYLAARQS
jgi:hypothetical protein